MHLHQHGGMAALYALSHGGQVSGMRFTKTYEFNNLDVTLLFALSLREHGTAEALRGMARRIRDRVCREHRPNMRALMECRDDQKVITAALNIVQRVTDLLQIHPGTPFQVKQAPPLELVEPPCCHMKPMRLAGPADARHWACQHCTHTKPLEFAG